MNYIPRLSNRIILFILVILFVWYIVPSPTFISLTFGYFIVAYIILPFMIHGIAFILRRGRIPRYTRADDGLSADPVNIIIIGSEDDLRIAFAYIGWYTANNLNLKTAWKMAWAFLRNKSYPEAPFSSLYLFGKIQDIGFQEPINNSPRIRHHVRFWQTNTNIDETNDISDIKFWIKKKKIDPNLPVMWIGSASKDTGFGLSSLTYQFTHRVDKNVDNERDYILILLRQAGLVSNEQYFDPGVPILGKYISDGRILVVDLLKKS
jgi:hypothetical protein